VTASDDSFSRAWRALQATASEVVETPCAAVFLSGDQAFKLKKPVDFGYLDYTTVEKRRWAVGRELAFNRETAPDVYLGVETVEGEPVLRMRRFPQEAVLARDPEQVDGALAETLGRTVARFHLNAHLTPNGGGAGNLGYMVESNAKLIRSFPELDRDLVERVVEATQGAFDQVADLLDRRRDQGFARRCHGDLHLANIFVEDGRPVLFDCIEFNDVLSEIDVGYDLAFLLMDLVFRGRTEAANRVLNAWLDEAARGFGPDLWEGLEALPLFLSIRAIVRCHVAANGRDFALAARYLQAGMDFLATGPASLAAVGGLSGSGKSFRARQIAPASGPAPGAVVLRSDEIRKRLWGVGPLDRLPAEAYGAGQSERVYGRMLEEARACLQAGRPVVLDAVFLKPEERGAAEALARDLGVAFQGVWMETPEQVMRERIAARSGDASDADAAVLETQLTRDPGEIGWSRAKL
jgi:hypothetical protein